MSVLAAILSLYFAVLSIGLSRPRAVRIAALPSSHPAVQAYATGASALQKARLDEAIRHFGRAEQLTPMNQPALLARAQLALMGVQVTAHRYREAIATYNRADLQAARTSDDPTRASLALNLSTIYSEQGDGASALRAVRTALRYARPGTYNYSRLLMQRGKLAASQEDAPTALAYLRDALEYADRNREDQLVAKAWEVLGYFFYHRHEFTAAEDSFAQAMRWSGIAHTPHSLSLLRGLALVQIQTAGYERAEQYLTNALATVWPQGSPIPSWMIYYTRAQARTARHADTGALDDARTALDGARRWRAHVLPSRAVQNQVEIHLQDVYSVAVETGVRQFTRTHDSRLLALTLQAAEENRAITLQDGYLQGSDWESRLAPEYWQVLANYRRASARTAAPTPEVRLWQERLDAYELEAGLQLPVSLPETNDPDHFLREFQRELPLDVMALSFQLGPQRSFLWTVTRHQVKIYTLPARHELSAAVHGFRRAVIEDAHAAREKGRILYRMLFGALGSEAAKQTQWLLSVEDVLFEMPFAALVTENSRYLVEEHALQFVPTLNVYSPRARQTALQGSFVAVADPIFQPSDPRFHGGVIRPASVKSEESLLPRLPNTARESAACARMWRSAGPPTILTGRNASLAALRVALQPPPAVLHISTHFVVPPDRPSQGLLALSLQDSGTADWLTVQEAATLHVPGALVVLNGCASGSGKALPGAGWLGMTRSWLLAGARDVAASYWPVTDDEGQLWQEFYRRLQTTDSPSPAVALQQAQIAMLRSTTWRSQPRHWAAYFITGKG